MMDCTECGKPAVTKDGRHLCMKCLKKAINATTPIPGLYKGRGRGPDHREYKGKDPGPWYENNVRGMEDGRDDITN